ncbi:MAG: RIP metalloprotease RseP [Chromatiaceae bacterium]|nr:RIP metalloprotease RseP [Chromatiaceae bacterium]
MDLLYTLAAFVVALAILIAVHEFGHFWVARRLGIRVLRFSIGFGRPLARWQRSPDDTEYVLAALPLGGYVRMLDERELEEGEEIAPEQLPQAFNRQPVWKRAAVVVAGPLFNLLFAVLAYWGLFMAGDTGLKPVVGEIAPASVAEQAGFRPGDELLRVGERLVQSWEQSILALTAKALDGEDLAVRVRDAEGLERDRLIAGEAIAPLIKSPDLVAELGLTPERPRLAPVIGELVAGEAAEAAGLRPGDRILSADGVEMARWEDWVDWVRARPDQPIGVEIARAGEPEPLRLELTPRPVVLEDGETIGHIGAGVEVPEDLMADYRVRVRYGPIEALGEAGARTLDMSVMMLRVIGRMLIGQASIENLSGPITIAETAGRTASYGLDAFVKFLAVVSISLGVLNLLPIPVLDGGHLLYFLIEWVKGSPLSDEVQMQAQRFGLAVLAGLMLLAFYVDLSRLLG